MPNSTPAWAAGMEKIGPGTYVDAEKAMHIDELELCAEVGVPYTEGNAKILRRVVVETFAPLGSKIEVDG